MIAGFRCAPGHSCGDGNAWWRSWVVIPNAGWYAVFGEGDRGLFIRVLAEELAACCVMSVGLVWFGAGCNGGWLTRLPVSRPGGLLGSGGVFCFVDGSMAPRLVAGRWACGYSFLFWLYVYVQFLWVIQCIAFIYLCGPLGPFRMVL